MRRADRQGPSVAAPALARRLLLTAALLVAAPGGAARAQERGLGNDRCSVQLVNQVTPVRRDGSWQIDNVPSTTGLTRARLYCNGPFGETRGQSALVSVVTNRTLGFDTIRESPIEPGPTRVALAAPTTTLSGAGSITTLEVTGLYADRSQRRIDGAAQGTSYASSNPAIATVDASGVVSAVASGAVILTAWNAGMPGTLRLQVSVGGDADGDGLPDDYEVMVGLDASDPLDALGDSDADGLTNLEEYQAGSHPFRVDSDGDGIRDGEEVRLGRDGFATSPVLADTDGDGLPDDVELDAAVASDPTDPFSADWDDAMSDLEIRPGALFATLGPLSDGAPRFYTVMAELLGRQVVDVTQRFETSAYVVDGGFVAYVSAAGEITPNFAGETQLHVDFYSREAEIPVSVGILQPSPIAAFELPAGATDVDLVGRVAHVACTSAGLVLLDVLAAPSAVRLGTLGFGEDGGAPVAATDVEAAGPGRMLVTLSTGELALVDVTDPYAPSEIGRLDLGVSATGVAVDGARAVVGLGDDGVVLVDLAPDGFVVRGALPGLPADGVDLRGDVIAAVSPSSSLFTIVDATDPDLLATRGLVLFNGRPKNVQLVDGYAYVGLAGLDRPEVGLATLELDDLDAPRVRRLTSEGIYGLKDVAVSGNRLLGADVLGASDIVVLDRSDPEFPFFLSLIIFPGGLYGYGVDATDDLVAVTAGTSLAPGDRLFVGRFRPPSESLAPLMPVGLGPRGTPTFGSGDRVRPVAELLSPRDASTAFVDEPLAIEARVSDDSGAIARLEILVDGDVVTTLDRGPWSYTLPGGQLAEGLHTFSARAQDGAGNVGLSALHLVTLVPAPTTEVIGVVVDAEGVPFEGASVGLAPFSGGVVTLADGSFSLADVRAREPFSLTVVSGIGAAETFGPFDPVADGTTDVGVLMASGSAADRLVGPVVAAPVMLELEAPGVSAPGLVTFSEGFAATPAHDPVETGAVVRDGLLLAQREAPVSAGAGTVDLVVPTGTVYDLPAGTTEVADLVVHGTLRLSPDGDTLLRVSGDLSGTGRVEGSIRRTEIVVGGVLDLRLDGADPGKPRDIVTRGDLRLRVGVTTPGVSICEMAIATLLVDESPAEPTPGNLNVLVSGDLLMDPVEGFIGAQGTGRADISPELTRVRVDGDLVTGEINAAPSLAPFQGSPYIDLLVSGDADVGEVHSQGGLGYGVGADRLQVGGDLVVTTVLAGHGRGVEAIVGGRLEADSVGSGVSTTAYQPTGPVRLDVGGDVDVGHVFSGDHEVEAPGAAVGEINIVSGGDLTAEVIETGSVEGESFLQSEIRIHAARLVMVDGTLATRDDMGGSGSIHVRADEVVLRDTSVGTARFRPAYDTGASSFSETGNIYIDAHTVHLDGASLTTGGTSGYSGSIAITAAQGVWIDASTLASGDVVCPSSGDPFTASGRVSVNTATSIVLDEGGTSVVSGDVLGSCVAFRGGVDLVSGERVLVGAGATPPIVLGDDPEVVANVVEAYPFVFPPGTRELPDGFRDRGTGFDGTTFVSAPIDSGSDFTQYLMAAYELGALPQGGSVDVRFATTNDLVCPDWQWRDDVRELAPGRWFAYRVSLYGTGPVGPTLDALSLTFARHPCRVDGAPCDDGNPCTSDTCVAGTCVFTDLGDPQCEYPEGGDCYGGGGGEETQ